MRKGVQNVIAKLLGFMNVNFTNNQGEVITGRNIFCAFEDTNVQGYRTEKFFIGDKISLPENTKINDNLNICFNYKGRIESITKA